MKNTIWIAGIMMAGALAAQDNQVKTKAGARSGGRIVVGEGKLAAGQFIIEANKMVLNGQTMEFVTGMIQGPVVKNAPYAAEAVTETTQKLFDGNQIVRKSTVKQYRDSEGRERREESMGAIFITDPVAKVRFTLRPEIRTAEQQTFTGMQVFRFDTLKGGEARAITLTAPAARGGGRSATPTGDFITFGPTESGEVKREDLGTRMVEGVQAQGSRTTRTIPAGQIGNTRPIEIVDERWFSPELDLTVMTRHSDPREGDTEFRLTNIQRIEQVRSLFEVPSDYQTQTSGGGARGALKSKAK